MWYVGRKTQVNFALLGHALEESGPWQGQKIQVNKRWYLSTLRAKVESTDWEGQKRDVERFLKPQDLDLLQFLSIDFFLDRLNQLELYLAG